MASSYIDMDFFIQATNNYLLGKETCVVLMIATDRALVKSVTGLDKQNIWE